mmetsp:Transcript_4927/g.9937  ORF Transcript_4927/g.9937 Transcript_4927/m.9937 type:complete len:96 (-) Transcript_4927:1415-1702(-)
MILLVDSFNHLSKNGGMCQKYRTEGVGGLERRREVVVKGGTIPALAHLAHIAGWRPSNLGCFIEDTVQRPRCSGAPWDPYERVGHLERPSGFVVY